MYYIVYGIFWLISLLPFRVLYILSDGIYGFLFYISRYRRDIVFNNLRIAFPEKTEKERLLIAKKFYHNLVDTIVETIKMISVSEKSIVKRFTGNWEVVNAFHASGRSIQIHAGHNFNWELCNASCPSHLQMPFLAVYMPLSNKNFDRLVYKFRSRFGTKLLRATHMQRRFFTLPKYSNMRWLWPQIRIPVKPTNAWWFQFFWKTRSFCKRTR